MGARNGNGALSLLRPMGYFNKSKTGVRQGLFQIQGCYKPVCDTSRCHHYCSRKNGTVPTNPHAPKHAQNNNASPPMPQRHTSKISRRKQACQHQTHLRTTNRTTPATKTINSSSAAGTAPPSRRSVTTTKGGGRTNSKGGRRPVQRRRTPMGNFCVSNICGCRFANTYST